MARIFGRGLPSPPNHRASSRGTIGTGAPLPTSPSHYVRACAQHDGDGCMLANGVLSLSPVKSHVWFDATHGPPSPVSPSPYLVPGSPHGMVLALRQAGSDFVPVLPHAVARCNRAGRIAQTNPGLLKTVTQNVTLIGRYDETPPIEQQQRAGGTCFCLRIGPRRRRAPAPWGARGKLPVSRGESPRV